MGKKVRVMVLAGLPRQSNKIAGRVGIIVLTVSANKKIEDAR